jgi:hypothetical protein
MDSFSGARYSATAMRRFYPAIHGRNLTFQPSQYGYAAADSGEKKTVLTWLSSLTESEGFKETAGSVTGTLLGKAMSGLDQAALDREAKRQAMLDESAARAEESRARAVALQNLGSSGGAPSAAVWIGGGVALLLLAGVGIYFATRAPKTDVKETA